MLTACLKNDTLQAVSSPRPAAIAAYPTAELSDSAGIEWDTLNQTTRKLYSQGHYSEAAKVARQALSVAKRTVGPNHPDYATSLNNLALLYSRLGRYDKAEPLYLRALTIFEKALGPDHPYVVTTLENMADLYRAMNKFEEAEKMEMRIRAIKARQ